MAARAKTAADARLARAAQKEARPHATGLLPSLAAHLPVRRRQAAACCYWTVRDTSSSTNEVCSEESSVPVNLIFTVWPMYALRSAVWTA